MLVLPKLQVNSQKLRVQAPQNFEFESLTLQLPIQTPNFVAPELQAFVSSLAISAKRAHPSAMRTQVIVRIIVRIFKLSPIHPSVIYQFP